MNRVTTPVINGQSFFTNKQQGWELTLSRLVEIRITLQLTTVRQSWIRPFFFFSSFRPLACYSSASLHLFIGRPRLLFPSGIPSWTFFTSRTSATLDMRMLHSVLLLCTHDVMFWIPHASRILSSLILSRLVLFIKKPRIRSDLIKSD